MRKNKKKTTEKSKAIEENEPSTNQKTETADKAKDDTNRKIGKVDRKRVNKKDKTSHAGIIVIICISITIIILVNVICVIVTCCPELFSKLFGVDLKVCLPANNRVEISIVSTGLSIIGIAVAVWTGLNIANMIDKKRLDDVDKKIEKLIDTGEKLQEELEKRIKFVEFVEDVRIQQNKIDKDKLLYEMYLIPKDEATQKLAAKFNETFQKSDTPFLKLLEIEQKFRSVYEMHRSEFCQDENLVNIAKEGISLAKKLLEDSNEDTVKLYLRFRIAEFYFYQGYCCMGEKRVICYKEAIKIFEACKGEFHAYIPEFKSDEEYPDITYLPCLGEEYDISAYFCNSMGEAYSKIVEIKNELVADRILKEEIIKEYGLKAVFYCAYADYWKVNSVYKRDKGCAIERMYGENLFLYYDELEKEYKEALKLDFKNKNNFKVLVSLYDKKVNHILKIASVTLPAKREIPLCDKKFADTWTELDEKSKGDILKLLCDIHTLSEQAKALHSSESVGYQYDCIYYRDMCAIYGNHTREKNLDMVVKMKKKAKTYLSKAEENWIILNILAPYNKDKPRVNPMTQILRDDLDNLKKLL